MAFPFTKKCTLYSTNKLDLRNYVTKGNNRCLFRDTKSGISLCEHNVHLFWMLSLAYIK